MLQNQKLTDFIEIVADDDFVVASGCVLMAQVAMSVALIEMSFQISLNHRSVFKFQPLIKHCQEGRKIALEYLEEDFRSLSIYKKNKKEGRALLFRSNKSQYALVQTLIRVVCSLENEVYLSVRSDYLTGVSMLKTSLECINRNLKW